MSIILTFLFMIGQAQAFVGDCTYQLRQEAETRLVSFLGEVNQKFLAGQITTDERNTISRELMNEFVNQEGISGDEADAFMKSLDLQNLAQERQEKIFAVQNALTNIIVSANMGRWYSTADSTVLQSIGWDSVKIQTFYHEAREQYGYLLDTLSSYGIRFHPYRKKWDFSDATLTVGQVMQDARLRSAFKLFFAYIDLENLFSADRDVAIEIAPGTMLLPSSEIMGELPFMNKGAYTTNVRNNVEDFKEDIHAFLVNARQDAQIQFADFTPFDRDGNWKTTANAAYNRLVERIKLLEDLYGVAPDMREALRMGLIEALRLQGEYLGQYSQQLSTAIKVLAAAPLIPIAIYVAPQMAPALLKMGVGFTAGRALINTAVDVMQFGGNPFCYLAERKYEYAIQALGSAEMLAAIPLATAGLSIGAGLATGSTIVATTTFGVLNLGTAIAFVGSAGFNAYKGFRECRAAFTRVEAYAELGDQASIDAAGSLALKTCFEGGIDLVFAIAGARTLLNAKAEFFVEEQNDLTARLKDAETALGRKLSFFEKVALEKAHNVGRGEVGKDGGNPAGLGNYTRSQLKRKTEILRNAGYSKDEVSRLLRLGIAGENPNINFFSIPTSTPEETARLNEEALNKLYSSEVKVDRGRLEGLTSDQAIEVFNTINNHPVSSNYSDYDPEGSIGFCFGRAAAVHIELLNRGVTKDAIRKVWAVGKLQSNGTNWRYHVSTVVKGSDGSWYALDTIFGRVVKIETWIEGMKNTFDKTGTMRVHFTEAKRFGPSSMSTYTPSGFTSPSYNGFFNDLMAAFRDSARTTPSFIN